MQVQVSRVSMSYRGKLQAGLAQQLSPNADALQVFHKHDDDR